VKVEQTTLPGVMILTPVAHTDDRGTFREAWNRVRYEQVGLPVDWVQDNLSVSHRGVVRGLHYQFPEPQGKLLTVLRGEIFDVAVDIRVGSPFFGKHVALTLSASNGRQLWIPEGFAHGFAALDDDTTVLYKTTRPYHQAGDRTIRWDDPAIGIDWPVSAPVLSAKDAIARPLAEFTPDELPPYRPTP
jgi:dTDP-4-dehydrorhamnose 3,5-epimerase